MPLSRLHSFKPIVDANSRVLILGSMPGPMALRKQQYYGFEGNHFWTIIPALFKKSRPLIYEDRIALVRQNKIALWDVLESCERVGAADSAIKNPNLNPIPELLGTYSAIRAVFVNGRAAHQLFLKKYEGEVKQPIFCLPSSSPANAAMKIDEKIHKWSVILHYLKN